MTLTEKLSKEKPAKAKATNMAAVDSFELLWREISKVFSDVRDALAFVGAYYLARRSITVAGHIANAFYVHLYSKVVDEMDFVKRYGPWAVITGGSDGIGKAYAQELARNGLNVLLISKEERKLMKTAKEIEETFSVKAEYICVDFATEDSIYEAIKNKIADKEIGILVNNVGVMYDYPQMFLDVPEKKLWQLIFVNVAAATMMTHMILPQMVERKKGAVVIVSSGSCSQITPQMTVYAATKTYLDYFCRGLEYEYKDSGITVQCLMPFYVATQMTSFSKTLSRTSFFIPSAPTFARSAIRTLGYSSRTTGYFPHTLQHWIAMMCPEWLWKRAASSLNTALREQAKLLLKQHP
ncbi:inactive hydroxysteroid dehydrogenase-like protein 1 [Pomacea canaliculata]|nr:inactive hydroxysteroid dehydrogenase-like protein 1 [Pomacea canaliculata]